MGLNCGCVRACVPPARSARRRRSTRLARSQVRGHLRDLWTLIRALLRFSRPSSNRRAAARLFACSLPDPPVPAAPMNEAQLRERVASLERKVEEKHKELLVLRETVPAKVRNPLVGARSAPSMGTAFCVASPTWRTCRHCWCHAVLSNHRLAACALGSRAHQKAAGSAAAETKRTSRGGCAGPRPWNGRGCVEHARRVDDRRSERAEGDAHRAGLEDAGNDEGFEAGTWAGRRQDEREGGGGGDKRWSIKRHAHERAQPHRPPRAVLSKTRALPGEMCGQSCRPALSYCWTELSR
eukprot:COSAG02_NODE_8177_length_2674_cov_1.681553_2_plen_296_part_00